ncbi:hypothetical protein ACLOJK_027423 [Asimina triloba]
MARDAAGGRTLRCAGHGGCCPTLLEHLQKAGSMRWELKWCWPAIAVGFSICDWLRSRSGGAAVNWVLTQLELGGHGCLVLPRSGSRSLRSMGLDWVVNWGLVMDAVGRGGVLVAGDLLDAFERCWTDGMPCAVARTDGG